jgi:MOSC domain-containing protein YiiM
MQPVGKVLSLFITDTQTSPKHSILLDQKGILSDKHYNKNVERSVLISSISSYKLAKEKNITIPYGQLGENLLIDYNPYHLAIGSQLKIGQTILEITQPCTLCQHLSCIDSKLPKLLKKDRGIFGKVIQEGTIKIDDKIYLL